MLRGRLQDRQGLGAQVRLLCDEASGGPEGGGEGPGGGGSQDGQSQEGPPQGTEPVTLFFNERGEGYIILVLDFCWLFFKFHFWCSFFPFRKGFGEV